MSLDPLMIAVQLYSLRAVADPDARLALVVDAGLRAVEPWSAAFEDPRGERRRLDSHGLFAPSAHVGLEPLRADPLGVCAAADTLGAELVVLWGLPDAETRRGARAWHEAGAELARIAERLATRGLAFAYHNHDWELVPCEDRRPALDHLLEGVGEGVLLWQPDLAWLARGGADPGEWVTRHARRIAAAHVKDVDPLNTDEEGWADLGHGQLDWSALWHELVAAGCRLMILEHDAPSDPTRYLQRSAAFARRLAAAEPLA